MTKRTICTLTISLMWPKTEIMGRKEEEFSFWKVFSGGNYFNEKKNYSVREHFIMNALAPSLHLSDTVEELPLSVKPDTKVSAEQVMRLLGSYYEGTNKNLSGRHKIPNPKRKDKDGKTVENEPDSIVSPFSNPWMRPDEINMYYAMGDSVMKNIRTVSVSWCAYSTVIQLRSWLPDEVGGVVWMALDNPGESPRFPIFCGVTELPKMLQVCGQHDVRDDAALWHYRKANRLATVRWGQLSETDRAGTRVFHRERPARTAVCGKDMAGIAASGPEESRENAQRIYSRLFRCYHHPLGRDGTPLLATDMGRILRS